MQKTRYDASFQLEDAHQRLSRNKEEGIVEGYASVFGNIDSFGSVIQKGAFQQTLQKGLSRIKVLWNHDPDQPIGKVLSAHEDEKGLFVRFKLSLAVQKARDIFSLIQDGVIDAMSFGFAIQEDAMEQGVHVIRRVDLWDVSPVTFPANTKAQITAARFDDPLETQTLQEALQSLTFEIQATIKQYGS